MVVGWVEVGCVVVGSVVVVVVGSKLRHEALYTSYFCTSKTAING